jgi:hypothetical protein
MEKESHDERDPSEDHANNGSNLIADIQAAEGSDYHALGLNLLVLLPLHIGPSADHAEREDEPNQPIVLNKLHHLFFFLNSNRDLNLR